MINVSDQFLETLGVDHTEKTIVELWNQGRFLRYLELDEDNPGSITVDSTAQTLRQCSLTLADPNEQPGIRPDELWPIGSEIKIFSGFVYPDGTEEMIPQGVYILYDPSTSDTETSLQTAIQGFDRSLTIAENRFTKPFPIGNTTVGDAIQTIIFDRVPNVTFNIDLAPSEYVIPQLVLQHGGESNPWKDCMDIAESAGMEIFFDAWGDLVMRPIPDFTNPVFSYTDDEEYSILLETSRSIDRSTTYSGVCLSSQNPETDPKFVEIWDEDPNSPTFVGNFGYKAFFIDTQFIAAADLARPLDVAIAKLREVRGVSEQVTFKAIANFAHEQNDPIEIRRMSANISAIYTISAYTRSLAPGSSLDATTKKKKVISND